MTDGQETEGERAEAVCDHHERGWLKGGTAAGGL